MRHWKVLAALLALVLVLGVLYAAGATLRAGWAALIDAGEDIGLTDDFVLNGERAEDLVMFANSITLGDASLVHGDAALVGNTISVSGLITGDLSATASQIIVGDGARVEGDAHFAGETLRINGAIAGDVNVSVEKVTLGPASQLGAEVQVCARIINDERLNAPSLTPCQPAGPGLVAPLWAQDAASAAGAALFALVSVLAGGVIVALPHALAPLRLGRLDEQLRARPLPRLIAGLLLIGLWTLVAVLLLGVPTGGLGNLLRVFFIGASMLLGGPLVWLGATLCSGWLGSWFVRAVKRPHTPAPLAALFGGLVLSGLLMLLGPVSTLGLIGLALLALIGLAALNASRAARAAQSDPRQTSFFVQG